MFVEKEKPRYYWRSDTKSPTGYSIRIYPKEKLDSFYINNFIRFLTDYEIQKNIDNLPQSYYEKQEE